MPINPDAVGTKSEPARRKWSSKDALIYALGVGAGAADPLDELQFTTENTADTSHPSDHHGDGGQGITLHQEIPVEGELESVSEITGIYDKGKGAVVVSESTATLVGTGATLFSTRMSAYIRGEGGWGGDRGPSGTPNQAPERDPDHAVTVQTRHDQALLYRLSGDRNPLHSDPSFAAMGGFDRPILHGLCTYGFTGRALLHELCDSDPARFKGLDARFSSPVMPGEALTVKAWDDGEGTAVFQTCGEDGRVVIDAGRVTYTG